MSDLPKILFVDDDQASHLPVISALSGPYELTCVDSGQAALDWLANNSAELLLVDVQMPDIDGLEVCRRFKNADGCAEVPVLFISGNDDIEDRLRCYEAGGADFIAKPIHVRELKAKVDYLLAAAAQARQTREMASFASSTAMTAMTSMSEMGTLLEVLKKFNACDDFAAVAQCVIDGVAVFGLQGVVEVVSPAGKLLKSDRGAATPLESSVIAHMRTMERIASFKTRLFIHYERVALLISTMPVHDTALCGRLRDHLAILVEAADVSIRGLVATHQAMERGQAIARAVAKIGDTLRHIDADQRANRIRVRTAVEGMISRVEKVLLEVALTQTEEAHLMGVVREGAETVINTHRIEVVIQNQLSDIVKELQGLMA